MKLGLALAVLVAALATAPSALACDGIAGARCGTVTVPLDRSDPGAGTTTVAYALVTRPGSESTILFNPGGPGSAAIPDGPALTRLAPDRSLLLIDPRGTGRSDPVTCTGDASLAFASHEQFTRAIGGCGRSLGAARPVLRQRGRGRRLRGRARRARDRAGRPLGRVLRHVPDARLRRPPSRARPLDRPQRQLPDRVRRVGPRPARRGAARDPARVRPHPRLRR